MQGRARHARRVGALLLFAVSVAGLSANGIAGADTSQVKGAASASAETFTFEIGSGGSAIGFSYGKSTAAYQDITASSEGRAIDLGLLQQLFGLSRCDGKFPPVINPATNPPKTAVDSFTDKAADSRVTEVRLPGMDKAPMGPVVGTQDATAKPQPWSQSKTTTVNSDLMILGVDGGRTESTTEWVNGTRVAHAVSTADRIRIGGGFITLVQPRWEAVAKSGAENYTTASFTFQRATLLGIPRSAESIYGDLKWFKSTIEQLLSSFGVEFQMPEARQTSDGGIEITPMGFLIKEPPLGRSLIVPFLNSDIVDQMRQEQIDASCGNTTSWTVIGLLRDVFAGVGDIRLLLGGARAATDSTDYAYHPEPEAPLAPEEVEVPTTTFAETPPPPTEETYYEPGTPGESFDSGYESDGTTDLGMETTTVEELTPLAEEPVAETEPADKEEKSTDLDEIAAPSKEKSDSSAAAVAVGVAALLGALGLSVGDRLAGRRAKRRIA
jgi:hypothetical protein